MVEDKKIASIITKNLGNYDRLPQILIEEANRNGGKDNITVLLSQVREQ
jgi:serine/threonine protein phosphatase PrpC